MSPEGAHVRPLWAAHHQSGALPGDSVPVTAPTGTHCPLAHAPSPQYGKKKLKYLPYHHQHEYFFLSECRARPAPPGSRVCPCQRPPLSPQSGPRC